MYRRSQILPVAKPPLAFANPTNIGNTNTASNRLSLDLNIDELGFLLERLLALCVHRFQSGQEIISDRISTREIYRRRRSAMSIGQKQRDRRQPISMARVFIAHQTCQELDTCGCQILAFLDEARILARSASAEFVALLKPDVLRPWLRLPGRIISSSTFSVFIRLSLVSSALANWYNAYHLKPPERGRDVPQKISEELIKKINSGA